MSAPKFFLAAGIAMIAATASGENALADPMVGMDKAKACRTCHGIDGIAKIPIAPHLAGENAMYIITQLKAFKSGKREHEMMSVIAQGLSEEDMRDIAEWYASIKITVELPHGSKMN